MNSLGHDHKPGHGTPSDADAILDAEITLLPMLDHLESMVSGDGATRLLDLGCGPGIGTVELAKRFPSASIIAIDASSEMLEVASRRVEQQGVGDRVELVLGDFDRDLRQLLEPVDLVWASLSLHHTTDSAAALAHAVQLVNPGGRIVVNEFGTHLGAWPDSAAVVTKGIWARFSQASATSRIEHLGHDPASTDWEQLLKSLLLDEVRAIEHQIHYPPTLDSSQRRWLTRYLSRALNRCASAMDASDVAAMEELLDPSHPDGVELSSDVRIEISRVIYTGVRASDEGSH